MVVEKISRPALFCNPREEKKIDSNLECEWNLVGRERIFSSSSSQFLHPSSHFLDFALSALKSERTSGWNATWNVNVQACRFGKNLCRQELRVDFHAFFLVYCARASLFLRIRLEIPWKVNLILGESFYKKIHWFELKNMCTEHCLLFHHFDFWL